MRLLKRMLVLGLGAALCACASAPTAPVDLTAPTIDLVWPSAPEPTRVRYLRSVAVPADWGIEKSMFRRLVDRLASAPDEHFVRPTGVAVSGRVLYVADPGDHALWILDAERNRSLRVREVGEQRLLSPVAVAVRGTEQVYVADSLLKQVFLLSRDGELIRVAASQGLEQPVGVAYDPEGDRLFVADAAAHRVTAFDGAGKIAGSRGEGGNEAGEFNRPAYLSLDSAGTLLVTDALNFRIQAIGRDGRFLWNFGQQGDGSGNLAAPKGVASDRAGHIYVAEALFDIVQIFETDGTFLLAFGGHGEQPGQFWLPNGLFIDAQDRIYVADAYNRRVQVFGVVTAAAGASKGSK